MVVIYIYNVVYTKYIFNFRYPSEYSKHKSSMHTKIIFPDAGIIHVSWPMHGYLLINS